MHVFIADARRFVLARQCTYNVIIADLFHPSRDGIGYLYTREHFRAVRRLLSGDGIFCQWLPLYQMDLNLLRLIMRTFLDVFPEGMSLLAHHSLSQPIIGLIGGRHAIRVNADAFDRKIAAQPDLAVKLRELGLSSIYTLLGCYLAGGPQLREFAGPGPVNTDDQPRVLFQAPEFVYASAPSSPPGNPGSMYSFMSIAKIWYPFVLFVISTPGIRSMPNFSQALRVSPHRV
jgi:spermidine synthase